MRKSLLASLVLLPLFALAGDTGELPPTAVFPENFPGKTLYEFDYDGATPVTADIQVSKDSQTNGVLEARGSVAFDGKAAEMFFEQMTNPVKVEKGTTTDPHQPRGTTWERRSGKSYLCVKTAAGTWVRFDCYFNVYDVRDGTMRAPD